MARDLFKSIARRIPKDKLLLRYAADGFLITAGVNIINNTNNLFASRLGANDYQLSLVQFLPQIANLLIVIPGGLFAERVRKKPRIIIAALVTAAFLLLSIGFAPFIFSRTFNVFITLFSVNIGIMSIHNISWQAHFSESVDIKSRNRLLTARTQVSSFIGMIVPLLTGAILSAVTTGGGKIFTHQSFFFISAVLLLFAANNFRKLAAYSAGTPEVKKISPVKGALKKRGLSAVFKNRGFLLFTGAALFFHLTWHMDWTLYYIGQSQYLEMNEFLIMLVVMTGTAVQFITMRFWSRKNERLGVSVPVTFGILGLALCPLSMIAATSLPQPAAPYAFIIFNSIANITFAPVSLNMFQCLMQVLDEKNRSLSISVYTCVICVSNAVMPIAGVILYKKLGGDIRALQNTFWTAFWLRIAAAALWYLRAKHESKANRNQRQED